MGRYVSLGAGLMGMAVLTLGATTLQRLFAVTSRPAYDRLSEVWSRGVLRILSWALRVPMTCDRSRLPNVTGESFIFVSNHQSPFDPLMLRGWLGLGSVLWVVRSGLESGVPGLSFDIRFRGHVVLQHQDPAGNCTKISRLMQRALEEKTSVAIFPEGRKDPDLYQVLGPFRRTGLRALLAAAPNARVVPVVIHGAKVLFTRGIRPAPSGSRVHLEVLEPLDREADIETTLDACENTIRAALGAPPSSLDSQPSKNLVNDAA